MDFFKLEILADVAVAVLENEWKTTEPKTHRVVFEFRSAKGVQSSVVLGNHTTLNDDVWPPPFCRKPRTTRRRKPRPNVLQTTPMSSSCLSLDSEEEEPNSVLPSIKVKNRKRKISFSMAHDEEKKKTRKNGSVGPQEGLPMGLKNRVVELGGLDLKLIVEKQLTATDVNKNNNRLSVPARDVPEFLTRDEKEKLKERDEKCETRFKGLKVMVIDERLREYHDVWLKEWHMGKTKVFNLVTQWSSVVKDNILRKDDVVQLWSFRVQSQLCFALVNLGHSSGEDDDHCYVSTELRLGVN